MRKLPLKLQNKYYLMRHATSIPNEAGIIVSWPENGLDESQGLSDAGRSQAESAAKNCQLDENTIIYTSDFSRASETAKIVSSVIGSSHPILSAELRERNFGDLELKSNTLYNDVWRADVSGEDFGHKVESLDSVADRTIRLIEGIEMVYRNKNILLVSHGDTLQAIQAVYQRLHPALDYNKISPMKNAEIKALN